MDNRHARSACRIDKVTTEITTMIEQKDVDELLAELESMRTALMRDREAIGPKLDEMVAKAKRMRESAAGGKFEASVTSVHGLLESLRAGVRARIQLNKTAA